MDTKRCAKCGKVKPVGEFHKHRKEPSGLVSRCKPCTSEVNRKAGFVKRYGLTEDDIKWKAAKQGGKCAVCGEVRKLVVDHDHATNKVRELLCYPCNTGIGNLRDSADVLDAAARYLRKHAEVGVPPDPLAASQPERRLSARWPARLGRARGLVSFC